MPEEVVDQNLVCPSVLFAQTRTAGLTRQLIAAAKARNLPLVCGIDHPHEVADSVPPCLKKHGCLQEHRANACFAKPNKGDRKVKLQKELWLSLHVQYKACNSRFC